MKHLWEQIKRIPWWGWAFGVGYFVLQRVLYSCGAGLSRTLGTISYAFEWKVPVLDDLFPVVPVFVIIYLFSFVFWLCGPAAVSLTSRKNFVNYIVGMTAAYLIGFVLFIFVPTYMDRVKEGLLQIAARPGVFNRLLGVVYDSDGREMAYNLFPSYHCLISAYCYLGVRKQPEISKGFRVYSLILAILICLSTLLTKQHYLPDVFGGVGIAVICYFVTERLNPGRAYEEKRLKK